MIKRKFYLDKLLDFKDSEFIKVITGIRRCGKSNLLKMFQEYLLSTGVSENQIIYMNFEQFNFEDLLNAKRLNDYIAEHLLPKKKMYILLDEVQMVEGWQRVVNSLRLSPQNDITITGSNANLLSSELSTLLSGRYIEIKMYPLSFREFLTFKSVSQSSERELSSYYQEYLKYGGFPSVVLAEEPLKETILSGIYDTVLLNDVGDRAGIKDSKILKMLTKFLASNIGQTVNPSKLTNTMKSANLSVALPTVVKYMEYLENGFLFYQVDKYDIRGKEYLRAKGKYFMADLGLRAVALGRKQSNRGSSLENLVFLELLRRGYSVDVGQINSDKEIDFIARRMDEVQYVQVSYELPKNSTRETDNLLLIPDNYKKMIITEIHPEVEEVDGIPIVNVVDWLQEES